MLGTDHRDFNNEHAPSSTCRFSAVCTALDWPASQRPHSGIFCLLLSSAMRRAAVAAVSGLRRHVPLTPFRGKWKRALPESPTHCFLFATASLLSRTLTPSLCHSPTQSSAAQLQSDSPASLSLLFYCAMGWRGRPTSERAGGRAGGMAVSAGRWISRQAGPSQVRNSQQHTRSRSRTSRARRREAEGATTTSTE